MKEIVPPLVWLLAMFLVTPLAFSIAADSSADTASKTTAQSHQALQPDVEKQRKEAEQQAHQSLNRDAVTALQLTQQAVNDIASNKKDAAITAIEQATGKINILVARNPANALIPVDAEVDAIDAAPHDIGAIRDLAKDASLAVEQKNFPAARVILYSLMSEIRVRVYNIPLATYPAALKSAARLLDQNKAQEAQTTLTTALDTLVVVDRVTPIPLILARAAVTAAQAERDKDKTTAQTLLETAKKEIDRSKELGYAGNDPVYASLNNDISNLEKQLKGSNDTGSVFASLREKLNSFLKQQSQQERR
jgi:hypothetical protein